MKAISLILVFSLVFIIGCEKENGNGVIGPVEDIVGNVYQTVTIGDQVWMAENLKTTKYNDGTDIPNVIENTDWRSLSTGAYAWYENDETTYGDIYGALYNWYAVETGNLCPSGWHVPTDAEWKTLEMHLGMSQTEADDTGWRGTDEGGKLKEIETTHWNSPNTGATNETGFTALPDGHRDNSGSFSNVGNYGSWWSATEYYTYYACGRYVGYGSSGVGRDNDVEKEDGVSVRCLRD
ncbi:MAG: fibrobacter succinogenes major paralogous domain-containing protein [Bacteroidales bacterium]